MAKKKLTYVFGADLSELERAWKRIERSMNKLSAQFKKVGSTMTKTFTVPLVAMGAAATKAALDIDDAMDAIASGTGATGRALKSLQDDWKKLAGSVTQGFDVSAKVLADYNTRLGLTGKSLTDISQKALDAARLLGEDVSNVVSQSAKAMRDWAVPAEEMGKFMDVIFKASQSTGIQMGELSTQLYKYGAALRGMGFDLESSIALLAQFEQQGVNTERIMGSLSMGLGRMAREGITNAEEAFKLLIEQIKNAKSPTEATRMAIEVFGSRAGPDMALAIREGRFSVEQLIAVLRDAEGAIQQTTKATDGFAEQWARTKNRVMLAIEPMGKEILNIAESVMPKVESSIASAATAIGNASDDTKKKILAFAGTLAVGGPLLLAISATINALSTLGGAFIALAAGPAAPLVIATAGVLALVAALHELKKAQEGIRPPEEVLSRTKLSEQAAEIFHARHGKYPLTAKDYEEIEKITDELISESVRHRAITISPAAKPPVTGAAGAAAGVGAGAGAGAVGAAAGAAKTPEEIAREYLKSIGELTYAAEAQRMAESAKNIQKELAEAAEATAQGVAEYWSETAWEYQQGLLDAQEYFDMLQGRLAKATEGTDEWRTIFSELQSVASSIASDQIDALNESLKAGKISTDEYKVAVEALKAQFEGLPNVQKSIDDAQKNISSTVKESTSALRELGMTFTSAFEDAIFSGKGLRDVLDGLLEDIARIIIRTQILQPLFGGLLGGGLFGGLAKGGVIESGKVQPFASGGIVRRPTLFPMAGGAGLMGEAGPEAIMPLKRTATGDLGVKAEGAGQTNITVNISAVDAKSFADMMSQNKGIVQSIIIENILSSGQVRKVIRGAA